MEHDIELMASAIHQEAPIVIDGKALNWEQFIQLHPDRAASYRDAARNRIKAEEHMKRLDAKPPR